MVKIGIIGGTGLEDPKILSDAKTQTFKTPYGNAIITSGKIGKTELFIVSRHGQKHGIPPSQVNNRANIHALSELKCKHIIATTAVGSLREEIKPGDLIVLDQLIDFTRHRQITFHDDFEKGVQHVSLADPFSNKLRDLLISSCVELKFPFHEKGTVITIEGPRFSTRAESNLFRIWGADVINMSIAPEASLAREADLDYCVIALSTDYDCWKKGEEDVSFEMVWKIVEENAEKAKQVILKTIEKLSAQSPIKDDIEIIKSKIRTIPDWPKKGVMFRDITTLLKDPEASNKVIEVFYERYKDKKIDAVAAIESRGFILGGALAHKLNVSFIPLRKPGKLPSETIGHDYVKEYGPDRIEIHKDAISPGQNVLLIDDLIATGDTALAAIKLIEKLDGKIVECGFIVELPELKGKEKLKDYNIFSLVSFEGE